MNQKLSKSALKGIVKECLVEILSEGEIEGSATASKNGITNTASAEYKNSFLKDIFLNNTQVLQEAANVTSPTDSTFNFKNVEFDFRLGSSSQSFIKGVEAVETEVGIGTVVTTSVPVTQIQLTQ